MVSYLFRSHIGDRYCNVPPFGRSTIRKFHNNASAMKKLAARDFEDLLQVYFIFFNPVAYCLYYLVRYPRFRGPFAR